MLLKLKDDDAMIDTSVVFVDIHLKLIVQCGTSIYYACGRIPECISQCICVEINIQLQSASGFLLSSQSDDSNPFFPPRCITW